jgi:hypothetical protein
MLNQQPMRPHFTADQGDWLAAIDRRSRRQRRAMLLASGIAACLAVVAVVEALLLGWK